MKQDNTDIGTAAAVVGALLLGPLGWTGLATIGIAKAFINSAENGCFSDNKNEECTVEEASDLLGISEYTIKKKIREGDLKGRIVGKKYMIPIESIYEYSKKVKKSGKILGVQESNATESALDAIPDDLKNQFIEKFEEIWNSKILLKNFIESLKIEKEIITLKIKKLELQKAQVSNDMQNELEQQILDKQIRSMKIAQFVKICEMRIYSLEEIVLGPDEGYEDAHDIVEHKASSADKLPDVIK